jgi:peroxiredoxin
VKKRLIVLIAVAIIAAGGGYFVSMILAPGQVSDQPYTIHPGVSPPASKDLTGQRRPDYTLAGINGELVSATDFDGRVVLLNFWATWCKPCREEMPMLAKLQSGYSADEMQIVGIALDDVQRARDFSAELGINYPILVGSTDVMVLVRLYGNNAGMLPYSVMIDSEGVIRWAHLGELNRKEVIRNLDELLH